MRDKEQFISRPDSFAPTNESFHPFPSTGRCEKKFQNRWEIGKVRLPPSLMGQGFAGAMARQEARRPNFFTPPLGEKVAKATAVAEAGRGGHPTQCILLFV
ncbi:MAG: hypothetical protein DMG06_01590 [Acidobacteria bacterium]|nr:MAG: hypothetical protein DMG06_01590 [Acidobacteriota bacterium]